MLQQTASAMANLSPGPSYRQLYDKARAAAPEHIAKEPDKHWVAILYHNADPAGELHSEDFLWIKSREVSSLSCLSAHQLS